MSEEQIGRIALLEREATKLRNARELCGKVGDDGMR